MMLRNGALKTAQQQHYAAARPASAFALAAPRSAAPPRRATAAAAAFSAVPLSRAALFSSSSSSLAAARPSSSSAPGRRALRVRASWGAPVEFAPAKLVSNAKATDLLHKLVVDVGAAAAAGYTTPGQYVQIKTTPEGKAGFFAIASPPAPNNLGLLELLVKAQGAAAAALCALPAGADVLASPVQGGGFKVAERLPPGEAPTLLMFATGSGISPMRALIESDLLRAAERRDVRLYYGTRDAASAAYAERLAEWAAAGVKVTQVFSGDAGGDGEGKYVQDAFRAEAAQLPAGGAGVGVVLVGQKEMVAAVKEILAERGVDESRVLLNF